ncbi:MAG: zinc ribbon domain-containing protein [Lentisphaeria bacterium]|nr:zinc ribbon domain-containing protein [Lentisphaeria bacterium]
MKKEILIQFCVMMAALIVAASLAPVLQKSQRYLNPDKERLLTAPVGGMHKVISDWEWMRFINYLGKLQTVDESNVKEVTERLERLVGLDPKYERLYLDGLSLIQHADPKKTVSILEDACKLDYLRDNWKIPFYTGFVYSRDTYDIKNQNGPPLLAADHKKAAKYFKMALERYPGNEPLNYLVNNYVRSMAKMEMVGTAPDREYLARLRFLYREWRILHSKDKALIDVKRQSSKVLITNLEERLLKAIQEARNPVDIYDHRFEPGKELRELIEQVKKEVFFDRALCINCCYPASGGDKYCTHCGTQLEFIHGICCKCNAKLNPGVSYCQDCGTKVAPVLIAAPKAKKKK